VQADGPSFAMPSGVPGVAIDGVITIDGQGSFRIRERLPGTSPGETILLLREI